jgi:excisionase family DNA binding protein
MEPAPKILYSMAEAAKMLSISRRTLEVAIGRGMLRAVHKGRRVLIPVAEIEKFARRDVKQIWPPKQNGKTVSRAGQQQFQFRNAG